MTHIDPLADPSKKPARRVCGVCREAVDLWAWDDGSSPSGGAPEWFWDEVELRSPPYMDYICSWQCLARAHW